MSEASLLHVWQTVLTSSRLPHKSLLSNLTTITPPSNGIARIVVDIPAIAPIIDGMIQTDRQAIIEELERIFCANIDEILVR